ncbi:MAG: hypothetical protein M3415_06820 [Actinomycetota bacterium]|nr:hypothetical protein [Actinomycetota bacterium]
MTVWNDSVGPDHPGLQQPAVERLLAALDWVPVTEDIARRAAAWARRCRRSHSGIDGIDYLIAATADLLDGSLLTRNIRHLPMFPGLPATRPAPASCE